MQKVKKSKEPACSFPKTKLKPSNFEVIKQIKKSKFIIQIK